MNNSNAKNRSVNDRSWDLLAEMWLDQEADSRSRDLESGCDPELSAEMDAFFAQYDPRNLKCIERETKRQRIRRMVTQTLPRLARTASVWIVVTAIVGSIAIASSSTVRKLVANLLIEVTPQYTSFMFIPGESNSVEIPDGWHGQYYPSIIPDGLVLHEMDSNAIGLHDVIYTFPDSAVWQFMYTEISDGGINIDSENATVSSVNVMGYEATMLSKGDTICVYWSNDHTLHMVDVRGHSEEEALMYANSLIRVK